MEEIERQISLVEDRMPSGSAQYPEMDTIEYDDEDDYEDDQANLVSREM